MPSSGKKKKNRISNAKYEPFAIIKIRLKNLWLKKQLDVPARVFMLNISTSCNCNYTFAVLNMLFLVSSNKEMLTACLGGGCALVYGGDVATDNCLHLATLLRYGSEIGIFVIGGIPLTGDAVLKITACDFIQITYCGSTKFGPSCLWIGAAPGLQRSGRVQVHT